MQRIWATAVVAAVGLGLLAPVVTAQDQAGPEVRRRGDRQRRDTERKAAQPQRTRDQGTERQAEPRQPAADPILGAEYLAESNRMREAHRQALREINQGFLEGLQDKTPNETAVALLEQRTEIHGIQQAFRQQMHQHRLQAIDRKAAELPDQAGKIAEVRGLTEARYAENNEKIEENFQNVAARLTDLSRKEDLTHEELRQFRRETMASAMGGMQGRRDPNRDRPERERQRPERERRRTEQNED